MKRFLSHCDLLSFLFSLLRFSTKQRMDVYAQNINLCCIASAMPQHTGKGIDIETKTAHKKKPFANSCCLLENVQLVVLFIFA